MLIVTTFKWRAEGYPVAYEAMHVNVLESMVRRHYGGPLRFVCITDDPAGVTGETFPLWSDCAGLVNASGAKLPSCYRRLKLFDPATQAALGAGPGDRIVQIDLDVTVTGDLGPLFDRDDAFVGWAVKGTHHPRVFNGSMWMIRAGAHADVWSGFDPDSSPREARAAGYLGSDQSWMSWRLQGAAGWTEADGVYSFPLVLRDRPELPADVRVAIFHGRRKPWTVETPAWVANHWRLAGRGRCLILGYGPTVWDDAVRAIGEGSFAGVIASPEAAAHWPEPVTALAYCDEEALALARTLGFDETVFCGRSDDRRAA